MTREEQDEFAAESHQKAGKARETGRFADEIIPVATIFRDPKTGEQGFKGFQGLGGFGGCSC